MGNRGHFQFGSTHWNLLHGGSNTHALRWMMASFLARCWCFFTASLLFLLGLVRTYFRRFRLEKSCRQKGSNDELLHEEYDSHATESMDSVARGGAEVIEFEGTEYDGFEDKDSPRFSFKFPVMSAEEIKRAVEELGGGSEEETHAPAATATTVQEYRFLGSKHFVGFVEEPVVLNLSVDYAYFDSPRDSAEEEQGTQKELLCENDFNDRFDAITDFDEASSRKDKSEELEIGNLSEFPVAGGKVVEERQAVNTSGQSELSVDDVCLDSNCNSEEENQEIHERYLVISENFGASSIGSDSDELETENSGEFEVSSGQVTETQVSNTSGRRDQPVRTKYLYQKDFFPSRTELESDDDMFMHGFEEEELSSDGFMSEGDLAGMEDETVINPDGEHAEIHLQNCHKPFENASSSGSDNINNSDLFEQPKSDTDPTWAQREEDLVEGIQEMEGAHVPNSLNSDPESDEDMIVLETELLDELAKSEGTHLENPSDSDSCDDSNLESLWEHQDLVEQLKMELKKVRSIGLPTILEESESPKMMEDPIPWKFEEKFLQEDPMDELQKFYKSYRERMRKFDILNYQKMYAMGFLNLKDHLPRMCTRKTTLPSLLSQNLRLWRPKKSEPHPLRQLAVELHNDTETVYVGQACLSWEFLQWQYAKAREISESDPHGRKPFNQFATELQQFQVLLQRHLENETFQGPRIQNYVKARCVLRNLLQVPLLREDCYKDKAEERRRRLRGEEVGVTSSMVVGMLEESMRIFWEFIHADKEEIARGSWMEQKELLRNPSDVQLLSEVRAELQKKERKLKDLMRAGQCLMKRFQKHHREDEARHHQTSFLALVDMRLVSRILRMSNPTADQLMWCQKNLNRIRFCGMKIHRESSFLLFPC